MIYGIYLEHFNWTALIGAVFMRQTEVIKLLLKQKGIDINIKNIMKFNTFHIIQI